jgi:hypothetical protein
MEKRKIVQNNNSMKYIENLFNKFLHDKFYEIHGIVNETEKLIYFFYVNLFYLEISLSCW